MIEFFQRLFLGHVHNCEGYEVAELWSAYVNMSIGKRIYQRCTICNKHRKIDLK